MASVKILDRAFFVPLPVHHIVLAPLVSVLSEAILQVLFQIPWHDLCLLEDKHSI
jgi:hypothetical protein